MLDRLLADPRLEICEISGTSAGAMNAVVLADGYVQGGREGARAALERFWKAVSDAARFSPIRRSPFDQWFGRDTLDHSPGYIWFDIASRLFSPYDLNPAGFNPLRRLLADMVDFDGGFRQCPRQPRDCGACCGNQCPDGALARLFGRCGHA